MDFSEFSKYHEQGFVVFSCDIKWDTEKQRKIPIMPKNWQNFTTKKTIFGKNSNSMAMLMGVEYQSGKYLILIDIDNHPTTDEMTNGFELLKIWENECDGILNTPNEITTSGGAHYYYWVDKSQMEKLNGGVTGLFYKEKRYSVDFKFTRACSIIAPSYFMKNGEKKEYKWKSKPIYQCPNEIRKLPPFIFDCLAANMARNKTSDVKIIPKTAIKLNRKLDNDFKTKYEIDEIRQFLDYISADNWDDWHTVAFILKNLNVNSFDIFDEWSKKSKKYGGKNECMKSWNSQKPCNSVTLNALYRLVKAHKMEGYEKIVKKTDIYLKTKNFTTEKFKQRYISDSEIVMSEINEWLSGDMKFFCIKSPYNTGKTTMLKKIFNECDIQNVKILFITYRRSLASNTEATFSKFGFSNYLDGSFDTEKQIIQLDSINKIHIDYDMIVIDEIESVLAHLTGATIRGRNQILGNCEKIYEKLCEIINNSSKVICMDGDFHNRAYEFISSFNQPMKIFENTIKLQSKTFIEHSNKIKFNEIMFDCLKNGEKIVICCMSASDVMIYKKMIANKYPTLKICYYSAKSDDKKKKKDFENINDVWSAADVVIYSPSIESGVDFSVKHFDNLFVVYSSMSTCPRALFQMMARIRNFKDDTIHILFDRKNKQHYYVTFDEIRDYYVATTERELNNFDKIYCHNQLETISSQHYFYDIFEYIASEKGYKITISDDENKMKGKKISMAKKMIVKAQNISKEEYDELVGKQKSGECTEDEKWQIEKKSYCIKFGVDDIDDKFIKAYYNKKYIFDNHISVLDKRNIQNIEQRKTKNFDLNQRIKLIETVNNIIKSMGFEHCYDKKKLSEINVDEAIKYVKQYNASIFSTNIIEDTKKAKIGAINGILHDYGFKVECVKKTIRKDGKNDHSYNYQIVPTNNINVYVQNKINLSMNIYDEHNIFKQINYFD